MTDTRDIDTLIDRIGSGETGEGIDSAALVSAGCACISIEFATPDGIETIEGFCPKDDSGPLMKTDVSTSIDACRALHERVLPGTWWKKDEDGVFWVYDARYAYPSHFAEDGFFDLDEAAAYLIAILTAVKAERGEQ